MAAPEPPATGDRFGLQLLFITANRLGDAVLSTGALLPLLDRYPQARVTLACGPLPAPLFVGLPQLERMLVVRKQPRGGHWLALWRACVSTRWDLIVDLRNTVVSRLLRARQRLVKTKTMLDRHVVEECAAVVGHQPPPHLQLWPAPAAPDLAGSRQAQPQLVLAPTANWPAKEWPAERFAAVARRLTATDGPLAGAAIGLIGAGHERPRAAPVFDALADRTVVDCYDLGDVAAIVPLIAGCRLLIGNDSGLGHIAAALGGAVVTVFGPGYPTRYRPWGPWTAVARAPDAPDGPASDADAAALMARVGVDEVEALARRLLDRTSST